MPILIIVSVLICLFSVSLFYTLVAVKKSRDGRDVTIEIADGYPVSRLDVYCNDVYLGKTPLRIPLDEIKQKVPKWNEPPRQKRLEFSKSMTETDVSIPDGQYEWARFCYAPRDGVLSAHPRFTPAHKMERKKEHAIRGRYWMQYKKQGCLAGLRLFNSGFSSGANHFELTVLHNPSVTFFSQEAHVHYVLLALQAQNFQPNRGWIDHVLEYKDFLFHELVWLVKYDARFEGAIDALVTAEFNLSDSPNEEQCERILDEILNRAEEASGFAVPSLESYAIDRIAPLIPETIAEKYEESLQFLSFSYRTSGSNFGDKAYIQYGREGKAARIAPLEYAIKKYHSPQAFDRLVYEYSKNLPNDQTMVLVANYPGKKSRRLFQDFLARISSESHPFFPYPFTEIYNLELIGDILQFSRKLSERHNLNESRYIDALMDNPRVDVKKKVSLIQQSDMDASEQLKLFVRIESPSAYEEAMRLLAFDNDYIYTLIDKLSERPNPAFEDFLLAKSTNIFESEIGNSRRDNILRALYKTNTKKTKERIIQIWNQFPRTRISLLEIFQKSDCYGDLLPQWTDFLAKIADDSLRVRAVKALAATDTNESRAVLKAWAVDYSEELRKVIQQSQREREETMERARKLIDGEIHPDDLLPPAPAYVWNGEDYVKEQPK